MIDFTKPVQTRDGLKAVIISTNDTPFHTQRVVAAVNRPEYGWVVERFYENGRWTRGGESKMDLQNVPETGTCWLNIYQDARHGSAWSSREAADRAATKARIACVEVTYTVGQGL